MNIQREANVRPAIAMSVLPNPNISPVRSSRRRVPTRDAFKGPLKPIPFFGIDTRARQPGP
jgi:hypothetical protein